MDAMDWWHRRERFPIAPGHIKVPSRTWGVNLLEVPGGGERVTQAACALIEKFERNVEALGDSELRLFRIAIREQGRTIPTCPNPARTPPADFPDAVVSLGICTKYGLGEIWFFVTLKMTKTVIHWLLDYNQRATSTETAVRAGEYIVKHVLIPILSHPNSMHTDPYGSSNTDRYRGIPSATPNVADDRLQAAERYLPRIALAWDAARKEVAADLLSASAAGKDRRPQTPASRPSGEAAAVPAGGANPVTTPTPPKRQGPASGYQREDID